MGQADRNAATIDALARLLSEARERQGLSRNRIAAMTGLSQSTISRLESGKLGNPSLETFLRIASALKVDLPSALAQSMAESKSAPRN